MIDIGRHPWRMTALSCMLAGLQYGLSHDGTALVLAAVVTTHGLKARVRVLPLGGLPELGLIVEHRDGRLARVGFLVGEGRGHLRGMRRSAQAELSNLSTAAIVTIGCTQ